MSTESELIQKQREVREGILALKEQIPSARIFNALGKAFQQNSLGYWLSNVILLNFILLSSWILIGLILDEVEKTKPISVTVIIVTELVIIGIVWAHIALQTVLEDLATRIIEKINHVDDLPKLLLWLQQTWSVQNVAKFDALFGLIWALLGILALSAPIHEFVGLGLSVTVLLVGLLAGLTGYIYVWTCLLVSNLKKYQYEMNAFSPADSEIISDISEMLTKAIYMLAGFSAVITLFNTSSIFAEQTRAIFTPPLLIFGWTAIIAQFLLTRTTLGAITNRAKWKTLNRIRDKINALEVTGDLSDKDNAERLFRLADIHKQIMASNTKTFDLKSVTTLFSQLMLPLLGLLLGNLDNVLDLFQK